MNTSTSSTNFGLAFVDAVVAPTALFKSYQNMNRHGHFLLLGILLVAFFSQYFFFSSMSDEHLLNQQLSHTSELNQSELAAVKELMKKNLPFTGIFVGAMQSAIILLQILLLSALALVVAKTKSKKSISNYREALALVSWCHIPIVVCALGLVLLTMTAASPDLPLSVVNYASLNELILHLDKTHDLQDWAKSLSIFDFWIIALLTVGFKIKLSLSTVSSFALAAIPFIAFYGVWFLMA
ncbi:hypothetical protein J6I75_08720 [Pseudidiomarina sp. 1APP75-27a]|uniref:YIP1 family protein n=1 Tax=Pseudidiomarina terrestris TaxID=2820060 RepID=UPI002B059614|nr:YIP1 family protein [Pseudidiomarina sp. 1APP75-27a]MEA3588434.1 hypothetical protein [Pseudidiomarina sp. 1APP75-27a]